MKIEAVEAGLTIQAEERTRPGVYQLQAGD